MTDIVSNIVDRDLFRRTETGSGLRGNSSGDHSNWNIPPLALQRRTHGNCERAAYRRDVFCWHSMITTSPKAARLRPSFFAFSDQRRCQRRRHRRSMVEYYKDNIRTGETPRSQLDTFTRYEFSFSGPECSILGSFYHDRDGDLCFGADLENFYSPHNYSVVKPGPAELERIVNYREDGSTGRPCDVRVGKVRYSSSLRFQERETEQVPVYVNAQDFAGKRTALFGMTRTGKSNSLKKIIQAMVEMSRRAPDTLPAAGQRIDLINPFTDEGHPRYPIGQIIFDINGEYANPNLQDRGTAISDMYSDLTIRYSTIPKTGFRELKINFYREIPPDLS